MSDVLFLHFGCIVLQNFYPYSYRHILVHHKLNGHVCRHGTCCVRPNVVASVSTFFDIKIKIIKKIQRSPDSCIFWWKCLYFVYDELCVNGTHCSDYQNWARVIKVYSCCQKNESLIDKIY